MPPDTDPDKPLSPPVATPAGLPDDNDAAAKLATTAQPPISGQPAPKRSGHKLKLIILVIIIAAVAGAAGYATSHHHTSSATVIKKDIPVLTYGMEGAEKTAQYPIDSTDTAIQLQIDAQLFEGLVQYENQTKIAPLLATSWSNPNNSTWIFNLRQGVKFHSGRMMTAQDVKYTLDYAVAHQDDVDASLMSLASSIKQVDVTGTYQVKITTDGPDPVLLNRLAFLGILDSKAKLGDYDAGTGPYVVKPGSTPSTKSFDLVAFNGYWGGHVYTREVDITITPDSNQLANDAKDGKLDLSGDFTTGQLSKIKDYRPINVPDLGISFIGLNTEKATSPLHSLAARQAAAYALDVPAILKAAGLQGEQASQLVPTAIPGHDPSIVNTPYNPTKAKQLLASVSGGTTTPLTFIYPPNDTPQANVITKELGAAGFNVKATQAPDLDTLVNEAFGGQADIYFLTYTSDTLDGLDILSSLLQNNSDYDSPTIDTLATQAGSTLDPATRISLLQKIAQQVAANVPYIPIYNLNRVYALTKPYKVTVDLPSDQAGVYFWKVYQE